ncbi:MAG: transcriptional repressor [Candidatus Cloacimonadota bacterium]|nr:transcriptional repressor [Candidatus Cloacimonadota bacterium]
MKKLKELLVEHNISPSLHRIKILEYLAKHRIHPTADDIYRGLVKNIPTLSKTTVYNTLKKFTKNGILIPITGFDNEIRYEYDKKPHIHFQCTRCGKIYDIERDIDIFKNYYIEGHKIQEHHINLKGICKNCLVNEER